MVYSGLNPKLLDLYKPTDESLTVSDLPIIEDAEIIKQPTRKLVKPQPIKLSFGVTANSKSFTPTVQTVTVKKTETS